MRIVRIGDGSTKTHSAETIGAKAANLSRMAALGLPVPPAFVLPVNLCAAILGGDHHARQKLSDGLAEGIEFLETATGKRFGDRRHPLLVSVRSGAARSMPGMLDTVLNVGCTSNAVHGLVRQSGSPRFAWDCRRRFLESYGNTVLGIDAASFEARLSTALAVEHVDNERALDNESLERLACDYQQMIEDDDRVVPADPMEQLEAAAQAVYRSWNSERARNYRKLQHLEDLEGTAVTIQAMVFGNRGLSSGAGVAFSRDPSTGAAQPVIDVLFESQGEDVVSGRRTPETEEAIARFFPEIAKQLHQTLTRLEHEFADVQDVEFTIEDSKLWILQTRSAKRTPKAALGFAISLVKEGLISEQEALQRLAGLDPAAFTQKRLEGTQKPAACGTGASGGVAVGRAVFDSTSAERLAAGGDPVILVRPDTNTTDVAGFAVSAGIVTALGGRTAHAALVARQMAKACVVGCAGLAVDVSAHKARFNDAVVEEGDWLSVDGNAGAVYLGQANVIVDRPEAELAEVERWRAVATQAQTRKNHHKPTPHDSVPSIQAKSLEAASTSRLLPE